MVDYIVVGAGIFGSVFAREAVDQGSSVKIIEKRNHVGGNCASYLFEDTGIDVHRYGTHIFHTNSHEIWNYVNRFTSFNRYQHRVLTLHKGRVFSLPINLATINQFYGISLKPDEVDAFLRGKADFQGTPRNFEEKAISLIGRDLYEAFIKGYTIKQWNRDPKELPASIITRLPVRKSYFDSYFDDIYQGIPSEGYQSMFGRLLEGIPVELETDFLADREYWRSQCKTLVYTGPVDSYFGNCYGSLNWRSVRFDLECLGVEDFQGTSVMNYSDVEIPWTRIHEPKHLLRERAYPAKKTVVIKEFSADNPDEPYYPVGTEGDLKNLRRYDELKQKEQHMVFGGRLAEYKYYDMHQVVGAALKAFRSHRTT